MFGYKVVFDSLQYYYEHDGEQWGSWSAESENEIVSITKEESFPDIASIHNIAGGEVCYVVWAQWGSGDSFGHHSGAHAEAFGVFKDKIVAETFAQELRKADMKDDQKLDVILDDGQHIAYGWLPFYGYFESLEFIEVAEMVMGAACNKRF